MQLYHTYKKKIVSFYPIEKGKVTIYNCGPTVYDYIHIGNMNAYIVEDLLIRTLEYLGYKVISVMNITDVGHLTMTEVQKEAAKLKGEELEITDTDDGIDRMEKAAKREGVTVWEIAEKYIHAIFGKNYKKRQSYSLESDMGKLNIKKSDFLPRATEMIDEQIEFIKKLEEEGYTYRTKKAVYFNIQKFPKYEDIVGQSFEDMCKGERADIEDEDRKHPADFRLWQLGKKEHPMQWDSPWGRGFPGWHIECSTMSKSFLGQPIDIHTGGEDHIKLHHANEMAQSEAAYKKPLANYWFHDIFLKVNGKRMGKSLGNAYTMKDIESKGYIGLDVRYFSLLSHYRSQKNFTWEALKDAKNAREKLHRKVERLKKLNKKKGIISKKWKKKFVKSLKNDLHIPNALAVTWNMLKSDIDDADKLATIIDFDKVLGLRLDNWKRRTKEINTKTKREIEKLLRKRDKARVEKNWKKADEIRARLMNKYKVKVNDKGEDTTWEMILNN